MTETSRGPSGTQSVLLACAAIGYLLCGKIKADRKQEPSVGRLWIRVQLLGSGPIRLDWSRKSSHIQILSESVWIGNAPPHCV